LGIHRPFPGDSMDYISMLRHRPGSYKCNLFCPSRPSLFVGVGLCLPGVISCRVGQLCGSISAFQVYFRLFCAWRYIGRKFTVCLPACLVGTKIMILKHLEPLSISYAYEVFRFVFCHSLVPSAFTVHSNSNVSLGSMCCANARISSSPP